MPEIAGHRLTRIGLTRGDIGGSLQPGKINSVWRNQIRCLTLGDAPMPLFIPGWRPRRLDHNARRDAPLSFAQRLRIFRFTAGFGGSGGFPSRRIQQWELIFAGLPMAGNENEKPYFSRCPFSSF